MGADQQEETNLEFVNGGQNGSYQREDTVLEIYGGQKGGGGLSTIKDQSRDIWRTEGELINEWKPV